MADLRAYIANCLIHGETFYRHGNRVIRDTVKFQCEGREFILTQKREVIEQPLENFVGRHCETSEIFVPNVSEADVPKVLKEIERICWLLSFASGSHVVCYGNCYPDGSAYKRFQSVIGVGQYFRPVLETQDGAQFRDFVDQTFPAYARLEKARTLNVAIDYMLQAERQGLPTECRLIFAFVLLENLKHSYATEKGIPFIDGCFRRHASPKANSIGFKAMLTRMLKEVGMSPNLDALISLRNEVIHCGLSALSYKDQRELYDQAHDLIREYILRLLGYKGSYLVYSKECCAVATIS